MRRFVVGMAIFTFALMAPAIASANDERIADHIITKLKEKKAAGQLKGFKIDLNVTDGSVHMKGRVSNADQRKMVLQIAARTEGVKQVINAMEIKKEAARPKVKAATKKKAIASSRKKTAKKASKPNLFSAVTGLTRLNPVKPKSLKPSVKKVNAEEDPAQRAKDQKIARQIISKLAARKQSGELRNFKLDVHVDRGVVWVKGRVATDANRTMVLDVARRTRGVKKVVNDLSVRRISRPTLRADLVPVSAKQPVAQQVPVRQPAPAVAPRPLAGPVGTSALGGRSLVPQMPHVRQAPQQLGGYYPQQSRYRMPVPVAPAYSAQAAAAGAPRPMPSYRPERGHASRARYDHPSVPRHAWPSYAAYPNYAAVTYPRQYSPTVWPYMGPFYPYPQVPLGWRKVTLEWDDGWWMLNFKSR